MNRPVYFLAPKLAAESAGKSRFIRPLAVLIVVAAAGLFLFTNQSRLPAALERVIPGDSVKGSQLAVSSADEILRIINAYRQSKGLAVLSQDDQFCAFANKRAKEVSQDWSQETWKEHTQEIFDSVCPNCQRMAENVSRNIKSPADVVAKWLSQERPRSYIVDPAFNVGCAGGFSPDEQQAYIALEVGQKPAQ